MEKMLIRSLAFEDVLVGELGIGRDGFEVVVDGDKERVEVFALFEDF